jgi:hypothetical protein
MGDQIESFEADINSPDSEDMNCSMCYTIFSISRSNQLHNFFKIAQELVTGCRTNLGRNLCAAKMEVTSEYSAAQDFAFALMLKREIRMKDKINR